MSWCLCRGKISLLPPRVTLPWRKRPWKMRRRMLGLLTVSSSHPVTKAPPPQWRHLVSHQNILETANDTGARQLDNRGDPHPKNTTKTASMCQVAHRVNILGRWGTAKDLSRMNAQNAETWGETLQWISFIKNLPAGQLSNTCLAMSVAESFGEKVKSCVFPLTRMRRRCTYDDNNSFSFAPSPSSTTTQTTHF